MGWPALGPAAPAPQPDHGHEGIGAPLGEGADIAGSAIAAAIVVEQFVGPAIQVGEEHRPVGGGELDVNVGHAIAADPIGDATIGAVAGC